MGHRPAEDLNGRDLDNGWKVIEKLSGRPFGTGGYFSVGYKVENNGVFAYLKALDFSAAFKAKDPSRELQAMTEAYNFERDLLNKCKSRRLDRIIMPLDDGSLNVPGHDGHGIVQYLIFELASGDIRDVIGNWATFDMLWCLRSLHNVAVGLRQLHAVGIAHQDLKPSNVLAMKGAGSKICDLGRASDKAKASMNDGYAIPGDKSYAPLDLCYPEETGVAGFQKRVLADLYLLGSLFFFYFTGSSAAHLLRTKLSGARLTNTSFKADLPYLQQAFSETLSDLRKEVLPHAGDLTDDIVLLVKQLCEPDPSQRGNPRWDGSAAYRSDLQPYISKLDLLYRRLDIRLR